MIITNFILPYTSSVPQASMLTPRPTVSEAPRAEFGCYSQASMSDAHAVHLRLTSAFAVTNTADTHQR